MHAIDTMVVHAGRSDLAGLGQHVPPIERSTAYPLSDLDRASKSLAALLEGRGPTDSPIYGRLHNPTVARWERAVAELEHAEAAVAFGSGMAAMTALLLAVGCPTRHVVAVRPLYGGTDHLLRSGLLGSSVSWSDGTDVSSKIRPETVLVVVETPANPTLRLHNIDDIVRQAGDVPVVVDNTFASPVIQTPLDHGASYVLHSATKFLGGHGDVVAGVVATSAERAEKLRLVRTATGSVLDPDAAYLLHRGLQTLSVRVGRAQENAVELARRLSRHAGVVRVLHPSLPEADPEKLVGRQMRGPGSMLSFEVIGGYRAAARVMKEVHIVCPAVSLGTCDTLIEHPAALTHRVVETAWLEQDGVTPGLLRLSVGIEAVDDIWADLDLAITRATGPDES